MYNTVSTVLQWDTLTLSEKENKAFLNVVYFLFLL